MEEERAILNQGPDQLLAMRASEYPVYPALFHVKQRFEPPQRS